MPDAEQTGGPKCCALEIGAIWDENGLKARVEKGNVMVPLRLAVLFASCVLVGSGLAQEAKDKAQSRQAAGQGEAEEMLSAVVRVRMKALPGARSNRNLGDSREGTGIVIDDRGHIVTIGYIVIEADSIEITTQDERTLPATLVGYDHASGFGLLRAGARA
jgi:S1-C subfamily serine protease